jgi:membrane protein implicated in regulation of membrane protease activity
MPIPGSSGLGGATKNIADHALAMAKLELKLALLELKKKAAVFGVGAGLLVGAAVFGLFALGFLLASAAAGLATTVSMWLALLIVGAALVLIAGVLALLGRRSLRRAVPPVPEQAIMEAKVTKEAVKANGSRRTGS